MLVLYIGNHRPLHSTETHIRRALEEIGHTVVLVQESPVAYRQAAKHAIARRVDLVMWTHTHGLGPESTHLEQTSMISRLRDARIPVVSYHLDRWWGLEREYQVHEEPFFRTDLVVTADGGAPWEEAGIVHEWLPPAVLESECDRGVLRAEYRSEIAFVGSWQDGYHVEWTHRPALVRYLRDRYGDRCRFWPRPGAHAVRGENLRDLYASVEVVVGDSCLVPYSDGTPVSRYCSDRIPETLGRGACLIHPRVEGVVDDNDLDLGPDSGGPQWTTDLHLASWEVGDWDDLGSQIDDLLEAPEARDYLLERGRAHTLRYHTYERRMIQLEAILRARALIGPTVRGAVDYVDLDMSPS